MEKNITPLFFTFHVAVGLLLGLIIGSFTTALLHRDANNLSMIMSDGDIERSRCTACGHQLSWKDLIPFFSWLILKGKCRYCTATISNLYPAIEIFCALSSLALFAVYGFNLTPFIFLATLPTAIVLIINPLRGCKPSKKLILFFIFFSAVGWFSNSFTSLAIFAGLKELLSVVVSYGAVAILISVLSTLFHKKPFSLIEISLFISCGMWLGLEVLPILCFLTAIALIIFGTNLFKTEKLPVVPSTLSAFLCVSLSMITIEFFQLVQSFY